MNNQSEQINELATALAKAQAVLKNAVLDKVNPFRNNGYSSLTSVWDACREPLTQNGLSIVQTPVIVDQWTHLETTLLHSSGQWIKSSLAVAPITSKMEDFGKNMTYCRRYSICAIAGISPGETDDDDGSTEAKKNEKPKTKKEVTTIEKVQTTTHLSTNDDEEEFFKKVNELLMLIKSCDSEYQKNFNQLLESKEIASPYDMPETLCNALMASAKKHLEKKKPN